MRTLEEMLLTQVKEEASEVIQRICKADRFGLEETQPGKDMNNKQRIQDEIYDLLSVLALLTSFGYESHIPIDELRNRQEKQLHMLHYSISMERMENSPDFEKLVEDFTEWSDSVQQMSEDLKRNLDELNRTEIK
jgi:ElaB/YqjD/DUF883 family membrane-anchored ribosome-binding protein